MKAASSPLVDVEWLERHARDPGVRIVDVRWYLANGSGAEEYARGHLPGAAFVDTDTELASPPASAGGGPGRHPLPTREGFAATLARLGVEEGTIVVAYDDAGGAIAARLWWLLRHFGHRGGRVLDGGIAAWTARGNALTTEAPALVPSAPLALVAADDVVDKARVDILRRDPSARILDARARDRYEGKSEPVDARPGHVPGARSAPFVDNLVAPGGVWRSPGELEAHYRKLGALEASAVVCYCGSGVTACHDALALTLLGRDEVLLYEGSWSDWSADASLPAAQGSDP